MKKIKLLAFSVPLLFSLSTFAFANIQGTLAQTSISNSHQVTSRLGRILRGSEPKTKAKELIDLGVTDLLIIKKATGTEVENEIATFKKLGLPTKQIINIPMTWNKPDQEQILCHQMLEALSIIGKILGKPNRTLYFHCTAGEDRTGALAGLVRMLEDKLTTEQAFKSELCERGYADGDENKPQKVSAQIHNFVTPVFLHLAEKIEQGRLNWQNLDSQVCSEAFQDIQANQWKCH